MRNTILIVLVCLAFLSCKKESYPATPVLTYKSVNLKVVQPGNIVTFKFAFTVGEGGLDSFYYEKVTPNCSNSSFNSKLSLSPDIIKLNPKSDDLLLSLGYRVSNYPSNIGDPNCSINDTCYFRFAIFDKAKHHSDTVNTEKIVIVYVQ